MMLILFGMIFTLVVGIIGHFLYDFTNKNKLIGFFFAKDESVWSHLKLGITPTIIWSIVEKIKLIDNANVWAITGISLFVFSIIIIIFYYLEKVIIKKDIAIYNISLFIIAVIVEYITSFLLFNMISLSLIIKILGYLNLIIIFLLYLYSEIFKPNFTIFKRFRLI